MADYFYSTDGRTRQGPITSRQLKQLADEGVLMPNALIWKEGLPDWIAADRLRGLFPATSPQDPHAPDTTPGYDVTPDLAVAGQPQPEPRCWYYLREGSQTGPITRTSLTGLLSDRIVPPDAFVWTEGMPEWRPAQRVPELFPGGSPSGAGSVSPPTARGPVPARQTGSSTGQDPALRWLIPVGRSPWAIASGYCGLLGLFPGCSVVLAPAAIITGIAAIVHLKKRPELVGMPRAISGIVMGAIGLAVSALMIAALASDMS